MSWTVLFVLLLGSVAALLVALARRHDLARMAAAIEARDRAERAGAARAQLQHPVIHLGRCVGCGACVDVCPEDGVLAMVHGQATVINGARCVGVAACERACPTAAITVTLGDLSQRDDVPAVTAELEAVGRPGLFLAGEVTAHALIKTAIEHGTKVARAVAARTVAAPVAAAARLTPARAVDVAAPLDLIVVGAGPAGLACALEAKRLGLRFVVLDQAEGPGGTVAKYPRRKLVLTQPVDLPLHGRLHSDTYSKEQLMQLWTEAVAAHALPLHGGCEVSAVTATEDGTFMVATRAGAFTAHHVCLAIGRQGTPRRLGVPGEDLQKVAYGLIDAQSYHGRRVLVVGGGDSAVETALALAEQPDNEVTLSYRQTAFFRIRGPNEARLRAAVAASRIRLRLGSEVARIDAGSVTLVQRAPLDAAGGSPAARSDAAATEVLGNDDVFVRVGGTPPLPLLRQAGVSFDPAHHPPPRQPGKGGSSSMGTAIAGLLLALAAAAFVLGHLDYYGLPIAARPTHGKHGWLRPGRGLGLALGFAALALVLVNLLYLLRRSGRLRLGSLRAWMTSHVLTGCLALAAAILHAAMAPRDTPGGHAFWALAVLVVTGAIGRYFYAHVPRAANGRELELKEARRGLERVEAEWAAAEGGQRAAAAFAAQARAEVEALIARRHWRRSLLGRALALAFGQRDLRRLLARLHVAAQTQEVSEGRVREVADLARRGYRAALAAAHFEDLRALLGSWRFLHRWIAALLLLLVAVHVVNAVAYGQLWAASAPRATVGRDAAPDAGAPARPTAPEPAEPPR